MKHETFMMAYTGAYPAGRPTPELRSVLVSGDSNFTFCFALSIARDVNRDGNFQPVWDAVITPDLIAQLQQELPNRTFAASLRGGDNFPWQAPLDEATGLKNAISLLQFPSATFLGLLSLGKTLVWVLGSVCSDWPGIHELHKLPPSNIFWVVPGQEHGPQAWRVSASSVY